MDKFREKVALGPASVMVKDHWGNLNYPAVKLAPADKSVSRQRGDEKGGRLPERINDIFDMRLAGTVPADREFVFNMVMPIVMQFSVLGCLKAKRITRGRINYLQT